METETQTGRASGTDRGDAVLIAESCRDPEVFGLLFDRHAPAIHGYIARRIARELAVLYPDVYTELDFKTPLELLVATILSAQTTDKRVNLVTPTLFARYPTAADYAAADRDDMEKIIKSTGFFRAKTTSLIGLGHALCDRFGG